MDALDRQFLRGQEFIRRRGGPEWLGRYVLPYYSKLMATNVLGADVGRHLRPLRARASELSLDEIGRMMRADG